MATEAGEDIVAARVLVVVSSEGIRACCLELVIVIERR
jgi:hypothetical protein